MLFQRVHAVAAGRGAIPVAAVQGDGRPEHHREVGVFTGGSVLATALAIPNDGRIVAIDVSREFFDLGRPVIEKAGVAHKVDFREGPALPILADLLADVRRHAINRLCS